MADEGEVGQGIQSLVLHRRQHLHFSQDYQLLRSLSYKFFNLLAQKHAQLQCFHQARYLQW